MPRRCAAAWPSLAGGRLAAVGAARRPGGIRSARAGSWWSRASAMQHSSMPGAAARSCGHAARRGALRAGAPAVGGSRSGLSDLTARGARLVSLNPIRETLEDFFVRQVGAVPRDRGTGALASGRTHEGHRPRRGERLQGVRARPRAVQPGRLCRTADRRVVSDRAAHGRTGRQDHQGSRPCRHRHVRPAHRRVHRHRPGVEGGGAAEHLQPAVEAVTPLTSSSLGNTRGWR